MIDDELIVQEAIAAATQAVDWDQDVDPRVVAVLLDEIARLRGQS